MKTLFAAAYETWSQHVPLFLPRLTPWQPNGPEAPQNTAPDAGFDRHLYLRYREYRALIGLLVVFALLGIKVVLQGV